MPFHGSQMDHTPLWSVLCWSTLQSCGAPHSRKTPKIQKLEKMQRTAGHYSTNNYTQRAPGSVTCVASTTAVGTVRRTTVDRKPANAVQGQPPPCRPWPQEHFSNQGITCQGATIFSRSGISASGTSLPSSTTIAPSLASPRARIGCSNHNLQPSTLSLELHFQHCFYACF